MKTPNNTRLTRSAPSTSPVAERGVNFYKEWKQLTRSPLGVSASSEETRKAIMRRMDMKKVSLKEAEDESGKKKGGGDVHRKKCMDLHFFQLSNSFC